MASYDIATLGTALEYEPTAAIGSSIVRLPGASKIAIAWKQSDTVFYVQCFTVNISTGDLAAIGSPMDIETGTASSSDQPISLCAIDGSNLAVFWAGNNTRADCRLLSVDGTGNVTSNGSVVEFDGAGVDSVSVSNSILWDSTHILLTWRSGAGTNDVASIFSVNTGTGTIAVVGTPLNFANTGNKFFGSITRLDSTKVIVFYQGASDDGYARVLNVNASTFAVTTAGDEFTYLASSNIKSNSVCVVDTGSPMKVINTWQNDDTQISSIRSFQINTTTWAITVFGAQVDIGATTGTNIPMATSIQILDSTHIVVWYVGASGSGFAKVMTYTAGDGTLSDSANTLEFQTPSFSYCRTSSCTFTEVTGFFVLAYADSYTSGDGFAQAFQISLPPTIQINIGDVWKTVTGVQINIGDTWKPVTKAQINIGDVWKTIF